MSMLSKQQESGNSKDDTSVKIHNLLQNFNILPLKIEQNNFIYIYVYFIALYILDILSILLFSLYIELKDIPKEIRDDLIRTEHLLFGIVGISLILWIFNGWLRLLPKTLGDLLSKSWISVPTGDVNTDYLHFLEGYRDALRRPLRYLLISSLLLIIAFYYVHSILLLNIDDLTSHHFKDIAPIIFLSMHLLFTALAQFGFMYCLGIIIWTLCISGWHFKKLIQTFELKIEPLHPDNCGGLKVLGNFCFSLASPIFIGSAYFIGYLLFVALTLRDLNIAFFDATRALILFVVLVYGLPTAIFAFFLPLWNIHTKMLCEREENDDSYAEEMGALRQTIRELLNEGKIEEAKNKKEKEDLTEALYTPYPQWPFNVRSRLLSSSLALGSSLLLGFLTALQQPLVELILQLIRSKP